MRDETDPDSGVQLRKHVAKCPDCGEPHHYVEVKHPMVNDKGYWLVECSGCDSEFAVPLLNANDSRAEFRARIRHREDEPYEGDPARIAQVARHNVDLNRNAWRFDYAASPLYECAKSGAGLDAIAKGALDAVFREVASHAASVLNLAMKGMADGRHLVVKARLACACGEPHVATFYVPFTANPERMPRSPDEYLLPDVSGAKLSDTLDGIASKSHIMDQLEKLIIRWNLLSSQILVAAPFVGHQWLKPEEQLKIWEWLLKILDAGKAVFLTRGATWNSYKKAMADAGLPADVLEDFGLANKIVARKATKQDFHAKFFAGIGEESCEVLSGSANLLKGDSVENMSFKSMSAEAFARRYIDRLNLKEPLPEAAAVDRRWLLIDEGETGWRARQRFDEAYLAD